MIVFGWNEAIGSMMPLALQKRERCGDSLLSRVGLGASGLDVKVRRFKNFGKGLWVIALSFLGGYVSKYRTPSILRTTRGNSSLSFGGERGLGLCQNG